ncbi:hypothetical protein OG609_14715 [Streptomyces sp. NBC_01224]|uniref:hypothetical protein n=1 Tax=Streptomyces sp. NBC_01224 TaxID=2903783 RepID=UPI002E1661F1|nr:hypothetical protein OG609_14715 [Streptomyces sp. NBC_01224]
MRSASPADQEFGERRTEPGEVAAVDAQEVLRVIWVRDVCGITSRNIQSAVGWWRSRSR